MELITNFFRFRHESKENPDPPVSSPSVVPNQIMIAEILLQYLVEHYSQVVFISFGASIFFILLGFLFIAKFLKKGKRLKPGTSSYYELFKHVQSAAGSSEHGDNTSLMVVLQKYPEMVNIATPPFNFTPFLRACWCGNTQLVEFMIKHGADVKKVTLCGDSCFFFAAYRASQMRPEDWNPTILEMLLAAGADINKENLKGHTALHIAAKEGHVPLTRWLLKHGADPDSSSGSHPLEIANDYHDEKHREVAFLLAKYSYKPLNNYEDTQDLRMPAN